MLILGDFASIVSPSPRHRSSTNKSKGNGSNSRFGLIRITKPRLIDLELETGRVETRRRADTVPPATAALELGTRTNQVQRPRDGSRREAVTEAGAGHAARRIPRGLVRHEDAELLLWDVDGPVAGLVGVEGDGQRELGLAGVCAGRRVVACGTPGVNGRYRQGRYQGASNQEGGSGGFPAAERYRGIASSRKGSSF